MADLSSPLALDDTRFNNNNSILKAIVRVDCNEAGGLKLKMIKNKLETIKY